jgi:hypothetical protein
MMAEKKQEGDGSNPFDIKPEKLFSALGLSGLKTIALSLQQSSDGSLFQFSLGVPESSRQGIFQIVAGEPKDANPPPFVPADAVKFQRWRIDGQKAWTTIQKMVGEISPQAVSVLNFMLDSANTAAKDKDPEFDIRKSVFGNVGDDFITYEKSPRGKKLADPASGPTLFLLGSPKAEQLAGALKSVLAYLAQQSGGTLEEREFLGRKVYSLPVSSMGLPLGNASASGTKQSLNYAASKGYVAISTDAPMLEEYLRGSDGQGKPLRETPGLADATQKVTGSGTSLFGYENNTETMRTLFETLKKDSASSSSSSGLSAGLLPGALGLTGASEELKDWFDLSLLPAYDKVAKYFYFSVYSGTATADGLRYKFFGPTPPQLRAGAAAKE